MQAQAREAVYWPGIHVDISDYVNWCTICTKHKASPPAQPMLPQNIPDGPWQDIAADYMTHNGQEYLIICDAFSKYPFAYKTTTKSAQSLCAHLLELISQYRPPSMLYTNNGPPFTSEELTEFLMCQCIKHSISSPHLPRSNGFIECQIRIIKTVLNTALPAKKPLGTVLLNLRSTPIRPNMPLPREILHNRTIQHPSKPSQPIDMERVRNFLLSLKQCQCIQFDKVHGACALSELPPGQEVLFRSPTDDKYIPGTIVNKATIPHSYIVEAQGKKCRRTREHLKPIHINLPPPAPKSHSKQSASRPKPKTTHIPKPSPLFSCFSRPLPGPTSKPPCYILCSSTTAVTTCPNVADLLYLSALNPLPSASVRPEITQTPSAH